SFPTHARETAAAKAMDRGQACEWRRWQRASRLEEFRLRKPGRRCPEQRDSISEPRFLLAMMPLQPSEPVLHPLQPAFDFAGRSSVGKADVVARTECLTWNRDHMRFVKQAIGDVRSRLHTALPEVRRHVGIHIECAFWTSARQTWNLLQSLQGLIAQADIFSLHLRDAVLRSGQGCHGGLLDHMRGARGTLPL